MSVSSSLISSLSELSSLESSVLVVLKLLEESFSSVWSESFSVDDPSSSFVPSVTLSSSTVKFVMELVFSISLSVHALSGGAMVTLVSEEFFSSCFYSCIEHPFQFRQFVFLCSFN